MGGVGPRLTLQKVSIKDVSREREGRREGGRD